MPFCYHTGIAILFEVSQKKVWFQAKILNTILLYFLIYTAKLGFHGMQTAPYVLCIFKKKKGGGEE